MSYQSQLSGAQVESAIDDVIAKSGNWDAAFAWGDHSTQGYLTTETDPVYLASAAAGITATLIGNWNSAFAWGNHAAAGYLTSFTETDPVFGASEAATITAANKADWTAAFGWGDHAGLYLPLGGGTLTGPLTLPGDPTLALQAATKGYVDAASGGGTGATDLTYTAATRLLASSTGTDVTLPLAGLDAGLLSSADKSKLDGVAANADVSPVTSVASKTGDVALVKGDVGLANVDNTSDLAKPVSTATQIALNLKANSADLGTAATTDATAYATAAQGSLADTALQTEVNDLTAAVTWADVPDVNITQTSVTQHQAALSITESQISDLGAYITTVTPSDITAIDAPANGEVLSYNLANAAFEWVAAGTGGGSGTAPVAIDNTDSPYASTAGEVLLVDTSTAAVTITMPLAFAATDPPIKIIDAAGTWATNNVTLARNGHSFLDETGTPQAADFILDLSNYKVEVFGGTNLNVR